MFLVRYLKKDQIIDRNTSFLDSDLLHGIVNTTSEVVPKVE